LISDNKANGDLEESINSVFKRADEAMYQNKVDGKES
jgi:PleD family two-component response regulator